MNQNRVAKNTMWILSCRIVQSLITLVINMISARYLGPSDYGLIGYAQSIVAFVAPIMYLGLNNIVVQEIVTKPEDEGKILGTSICMSFCSAICCIGGIFAFTSIVNVGETDTVIVCTLYSILLIFQSMDLVQYWYQAKLLSKYTSLTMLGAYVAVSLYKIYLLVTQKSVHWFAVANAFDYCIIAIVLLIIYHRLGGGKLCFSASTAKRMLSKSRHYIVSSMMVTVFAQTDKIMIKLMIDSAATGYYSAAVSAAGMTSFVFSAFIDSMRPVIFEAKKIDEERFKLNMIRLYSMIVYLSLAQSVVMTVFSKLIINILFGAEYAPAVAALCIVVWYTTFSYMGGVRNIWILAENKQKYLWIINLSGALMNIVINAILIPIIGIYGAAIASLITQFFTNFIIGYIMRPIAANNELVLKSFNPKYLIDTAKLLLKKDGGK